VSNMFRSIDDEFADSLFHTLEALRECTPEPSVPEVEAYQKITYMFMILLMTTLFHVYLKRLCPVFCGYFYPERKWPRALYLHHRILTLRQNSLMHVIQLARRRADGSEPGIKLTLMDRIKIAYPWMERIFGRRPFSFCSVCGQRAWLPSEQKAQPSDHIRLPNEGVLSLCWGATLKPPICTGMYCVQCLQQVYGLCVFCKRPIETKASPSSSSNVRRPIDDDSSEELGSSEDEVFFDFDDEEKFVHVWNSFQEMVEDHEADNRMKKVAERRRHRKLLTTLPSGSRSDADKKRAASESASYWMEMGNPTLLDVNSELRRLRSLDLDRQQELFSILYDIQGVFGQTLLVPASSDESDYDPKDAAKWWKMSKRQKSSQRDQIKAKLDVELGINLGKTFLMLFYFDFLCIFLLFQFDSCRKSERDAKPSKKSV
jgi:hypothetical protein